MRCASRASVLALLCLCACRETGSPARQLPAAAGTAIDARIRAGETQVWRLSLSAGQYAGLVVDQRGVDVTVDLFDPAGRLERTVDSPQGARVPEPVPISTGTAGTWEVAVRAPEAAGSYGIRLDALRPTTRADFDRVEAERRLAWGEELRRNDDRQSRERAAIRAREAAGLFRKLGDASREADALYTLGNALDSLDDDAGARAAFERALALFRRTGREREAGKALIAVGRSWSQEPDRALHIYREALAIQRRLGDRRQEATALFNLGRIYHQLGRTDEALDSYERARAIWLELGVRSDLALTLRNLGDIYQRTGEPEKALDLLAQAVELFEAEGSADLEAATLRILGDAQARAGRRKEALASASRALAIQRGLGNPREQAHALNSIGCWHLLLGQAAEARRAFAEARSIYRRTGDRSAEAVALVNFALADEQRPREAIASIHAALPSLASRDYQALAHLGLARAHRRLGDLGAARKEIGEAIELIESLRGESASPGRRASFLASTQDYYSFQVDLLMELHRREPGAGYDAHALAASEQGRARSLLDLLAESGADLRKGVDPALLAKESELAGKINDLASRPAGPELRELLAEQERVQARIRRESPGYAALILPRPLTLSEIQSEVADPETLVLQYALGRERSFLWAVTPDSLTSFELPPRQRIEEAARRAYGLLSTAPQTLARARTRQELADLSSMLLGPAASLLAGKRLVVVPDGALHYLPFAALPSPGSEEPLVLGHEIVTLPSASALAVIRRETHPRATATLAVVADPVFDAADPRVGIRVASVRSGKLGRLPYSREEADALLALAPPAERLGALGFEASRETVLSGRLARYRLVHFATHGILDAENPELSGLLLSQVDPQGRPREGFLRAHEIYRLSLPADLVVLSACRTALGREMRGEGLVGLTQGFLHAGARSVLVSLWEVDDRATAELMRRFYREMLKGGRPPAAALRAAQASLRREPGWDAPYFWAGFVLQGDWQPR
jgi:CHAT domain-containing protein/tetratricopeptide (TPR) repeat protein